MRLTYALILTALLFRGGQGTAATADAPSKEKVDKAIADGLVFLKNHQQRDGAWHGPAGPRDPAITALAVMAMLSAGQVPGEGPYGTAVEKGIRAVLQMQQANGLIAAGNAGNAEMYEHGIGTLMLAEAAGMVPDKKLAQDIRTKLAKAVNLTLQSQRGSNTGGHEGGWRYHPSTRDSDLSVTGWQILALRSAKNVGCDVPGENIDKAIKYLRKSQDKGSGGFRYQVVGDTHVSLPLTGTGILALEISDRKWHDSENARKARAYLLKNFSADWRGGFFSYGIYYCAQAGFQSGGQYWESFRPRLHKLLLGRQQANGCWIDGDGGRDGGQNYATAMAVLALTVEYRFLPIYQRGEDQEQPK